MVVTKSLKKLTNGSNLYLRNKLQLYIETSRGVQSLRLVSILCHHHYTIMPDPLAHPPTTIARNQIQGEMLVSSHKVESQAL